MVVDDRDRLDRVGVRQVRIDVVRVDERDEVDLPDVLRALDLPQLEAEQLHERAVLTVRQLVEIGDRRLCHTESRREVGEREGAGDAVGIGMSAERYEQLLVLGGRHRLRERLRAVHGTRRGNDQTSNRFIHGALLWLRSAAFVEDPANSSWPLARH